MKANEAIFQTMTSIREENGLTLDDVAVASRRYGAKWTPGFISGMKRNKTAAQLGTMLVLCKTIESLTGRPFALPDLFPGDGTVEFDSNVSISRANLRKALSGSQYRLTGGESVIEQVVTGMLNDTYASDVAKYNLALSRELDSQAEQLYGDVARQHAPTLSEERAAEKLGITAKAVASLCLLEYGRTLDQVTESLAGADATPQFRGRRTRDVIANLDGVIDYITNDGDRTGIWGQTAKQHMGDNPQWIADHPDLYDLAAHHGDTEAEQQAYEEMP